MRQIVLDTETTGLSPSDGHRIIEIGAVELVNRKLTGNYFHQYINPEREIDAGAINVHGITTEFLKDKPVFAKIMEEFLAFVKNAELVIHNASFDTGFIDYELQIHSAIPSSIKNCCKITDTLALARKLHPGQKNNLDALCKRYEVNNTKRELHGALLDANLLAHVYLAMTGGQGSLFDKAENTEVSAIKKRVRKSSLKLPVIQATPEEIALHEKIMQELDSNA